MKSKVTSFLLFGLAFALTLSINARPDGQDRDDRDGEHHDRECRDREHNEKTPLQAVGVIGIPGNPLASTDIAWVDQGTERLYFADRSNFGVDIIDAENDVYVGRVAGFAGPSPPAPNGSGPGGVLVTPSRKLWAGDGNTTVQVADVDPKSPDYLKIIKSVDVSIPACDKHCNRADELGYDPKDHKILAAIDRPTSDGKTHIAPYAALIDANTYGVQIVQIPNIVADGGLEQPLWDSHLGRFFLTVPSVTTNKGNGEIAIIDPVKGTVESAYFTPNCGPSGEVLTPFEQLVVECGGDLLFMNARNGKIISTIKNVPADELWFNPGDDRVYAANNDVNLLNVVDAEERTLIQSLPDVGGRNQAAFAENNHVFTPVRAPDDPKKDNTQCSLFGFNKARGASLFSFTPTKKTTANSKR